MIYGSWGMADVDFFKGENAKALRNYKNALQQAIKINAKNEENNLYLKINKVYEAQNNKDSSYKYLKKYVDLKNNIEYDEQTKFLLRQESKYEIEKNISEQNAKMEQEKQLANEKNKRKNYIIFGIVLITIILIYVVFISIKRVKIIASKNEIINVINQELIVQKKEITDSINYARRIQEAILPSVNFFKECRLNNFVLYKPKDIVAGDFYWLEQKNDYVFLAVADCTGHGVPGAMVSVVCCNALNRAVLEFDITEPGKILDKTRELVLDTFSKSDNDVKDGMDISLIAINKSTNKIAWAGANSPLWYVTQNGFFELKADKQPIGKIENVMPFNTHQIFLKEGDLVYMTTDGYADQFGGERGKKFKYKNLKETLIKNSYLSLEKQKKELEIAFLSWKGDLEQVDDVCVLGIKI